MTRLPLARSLVVALIGISIALGVTAALAVAGLYQSRQDYEDALARTYSAEVAVANLLAAGVVEEAVLRTRAGRSARRRAAAAYDRAAAAAAATLRADPVSAELLEAQVAAQRRARSATGATRDRELRTARRVASSIAERQRAVRDRARADARDSSRRATLTAAIAGGLALLASLGLVAALIGAVRRPLEALVRATRFVARGDVRVRVREEGPAELRDLAGSFNVMSDNLAEARRQVEAERERLATVVEHLGDALVVTGPDGRVTQVNPRAGDLVPELGVGGNSQASASPLPRLADALGGEVPIDHRGRTLGVTAARLGDEGSGVVWTIRDISERARLERAKSEFVATASHELRSPLTSIKGFAELLLRSKDLSERDREFAETVVFSTNRLVDLVNDLLDVTRIEAGHLELQRRAIHLADVVDEVALLMRPRVEDKRQTLTLEYAPATPAAHADAARMRQVVTNLLTNAHLYTPEGGEITLRVRPEGEAVALDVADTGPGMERTQAERIFERFYRGKGNANQPGTGLGLSIVKSLVDMHEGTISVDSEPGRGTTFTVRVPRAPMEPGGPAPRFALQGKRVLVVEDEPAIAQLIAEQLAHHDVEVVTVHSGEEALERLRNDERRFDAITLDILLGGISGFEVIRCLREDAELQRVPVVVVSVFSGNEALSGEWVVAKPIEEDELVDALGSAILAGRSRVLVVGREEVRPQLVPSLERLGIEYAWATSGAQAARLCEERRFEVALIDAGLNSPHAVLEHLDLRGRRLHRAVIVFSPEGETTGFARLGAEPVPVEDAAGAVLQALGTRTEN